ncbi:MAG: carboxypeptidase regulatory-like domain-containing protein [Terracidiphilus sp.]|nr:carboxypeptidase regulatory-like domain-containing protein [Terracidiphilus sp.]
MKFESKMMRIVFGIAFLALCASFSFAQGYGSISGTVSDPSGAVVASATITATQTQTGRETTTISGKDGNFVFPTLAPSAYTIAVTAKGFESYAQTGVILQANQALTVNAKLTIGSGSETVSVSADAPQVDTTTNTLSQVIDESRVADLPLNGRNAAALITLVAGVADASNEGNGVNQGNGKTFPAAVVSSANGTLPNQSNYLLDGGNNVDEMTNVNGPFPFPDALQEFSVQTSNYNAEFGQSAGAVVNIVTKSGGNAFHGDAFEFIRNGYFNARPYFATVADNMHRHQFGGTIGGPVIIPHISKGQSTQFFFGYQHTLVHQNSNSNTATVPTLAEEGLTGTGYADFSNLCTAGWDSSNICLTASQTIRNPYTNVAYPLNHIPTSAFDQASVNFMKAFPTASSDAGAGKIGNTVNYFQPTIQTFDEYVSRVDHQFGANDHLFGHYYSNYYQQVADYVPTNLLSYQSYFNTRYQNALLSETHTFTPNLLNNLILNYQREVSLRGGPPGSNDITAYGVQNFWQPNTGPYIQASITGYFGAKSSAFAAWGRNNYTFNDDLHWVKGKHNFAFGGHFELSKFDVTNVFTSYGTFTFAAVSNKIGSTTYQYPNAFANYLMGFMNGFGQGNFEQVNDRNHFPGIYAQDSWKATHKLTINYGIRWEMFAPWHNRNGVQTSFSPENFAAGKGTSLYSKLPAGMVLSGDSGFPVDGVRNQYKQFMPRAGFAYDVFGNGKTAVRGGFGVFYQDRMPGFFNLSQASWVPNTISVTLTNAAMYSTTSGGNPGGPFSDPYCISTSWCSAGKTTNPFPFTVPFPSTYSFPNGITMDEYDPSGNFRVPVTYDYNLTLEQQLSPNWALRLAYVGSGSRHQFVNLEVNPSVNNGSGLSANSRRVYNTSPTIGPCATSSGCAANYSDIIEAAMIGNAHYNSMQATIERKMAHGFSVLANYTWSKSYDDMPQATRMANTEDMNAGESYVYPLYPSNATGIPAAAFAKDIKALDRGISDIDHPHVISISYNYQVPKLNSGSRALRAVTNGWRTAGLIQHRSGDALTTYANADISLTGLSQDRAQRDFTKAAYSRDAGNVGNCAAGKSCVNWFSNAAFTNPVNTGAGTGFGNVVKGSLRGPGFTNWDGAVIRTFPVFRETTIDFRAEYFDILNHTELSNPTVALSSSTFGTITATQGGPRIAQFSLKYMF